MSSDVNLCQIYLELGGGRYQDNRPNHRARSGSDELHRLPSAVRPGGTPLYKPYRYVPPQSVGFLRCFGLRTAIDFAHFEPWNRVLFTKELRLCINVFGRFNSK